MMAKFKQLKLMVGIPASGKSTYAHYLEKVYALNNKTVKYVSRDAIRFALVKGEEAYFSKEKEVFNTFINEIKEGLENYDVVIADATHINQASRTKTLRALGTALKDVSVTAIVMTTDIEEALMRNMKRKGLELVPEDAIEHMWARYTEPELEEGFDAIYRVPVDWQERK